MKSLALLAVAALGCAALSCSSSGKNMTGQGGTTGVAGDGGGGFGPGGTTGVAGSSGGSTATGSGGASALADPCRGTVLPTTSHYVPTGLCARTVATGQGELRQLTFSSNGDLWGVNASGQIKRFRDADGDGIFQTSEIVNWATTGGNGQNVHIDEAGGFLYSGTTAGVRRWAWSNTTDSGGTGQDVLTGQPTGGHGKHTVHVWDGWMYVQSGSSGNVTSTSTSSYDTQRNLIKRFNLASFAAGTPFAWGTAGEVYADGLRNVLGFARDATGRIYGVQNGQDDVSYGGTDVHNDNPGEVIVRLDAGSHHGYPFCFVVQRVNSIVPGTQVRSEIFPGNTRDDAWCQSTTNVSKPVTFMQAHSAPMDITFFTGPAGNLPEKWRNGAFVSLHGSWNREPATGYRVIWMPFNADGTAPMPTNSGSATTFTYEVVLAGGNASAPRDGTWNVSGGEQGVRPVGVAVSPVDGALYVSSDSQGYVYRIGLMR